MHKVLVVDDELSIRKTIEIFLIQAGYEVATTEDVKNALKIIDSQPVDLILTDIIMPGQTGMDLLRQVKIKYPDIQIIIMTGEPTVETAQNAVQDDATDYLIKPVSKDKGRSTLSRTVY